MKVVLSLLLPLVMAATPLERFAFTECNSSGIFASHSNRSVLEPLVVTNSSLYCHHDDGLSNGTLLATPLEPMTDYLRSQPKGPFSISLWFTAIPDGTQKLLQFQTAASFFYGCGDYHLIMGQNKNILEIAYTDHDWGSCRILRLPPIEWNHLNHVVLEFGNKTNIYVNGQEHAMGIYNDYDTSRMPHFMPEDQLLVTGQMVQLDLYNTEISVPDVYAEGVLYGEPEWVDLEAPIPQEAPPVPQDSVGVLLVAAYDSTRYNLFVEVVKPPTYGRIAGEEQFFPVVDGVARVPYEVTDADYFNVPTIDANGVAYNAPPESIEYRLVALTRRGLVVGRSPVVLHNILVQNVNRAPVWKSQGTYWRANSTVTGLELEDLDRDMSRVHVVVRSNAGDLTLTSSDGADWQSCRNRFASPWQCSPDGNRYMSFITVPSKVNELLANLQYESLKPGYPDVIEVRVFDGEGGDCLVAKEHEADNREFHPIHRTCFFAEARIEIEAFEPPRPKEKLLFGFIPNADFENFNLADALWWVFVFSLICCLGCTIQNVRHCLARGGQVEIDDAEWDGDEEEKATQVEEGADQV